MLWYWAQVVQSCSVGQPQSLERFVFEQTTSPQEKCKDKRSVSVFFVPNSWVFSYHDSVMFILKGIQGNGDHRSGSLSEWHKMGIIIFILPPVSVWTAGSFSEVMWELLLLIAKCVQEACSATEVGKNSEQQVLVNACHGCRVSFTAVLMKSPLLQVEECRKKGGAGMVCDLNECLSHHSWLPGYA